MTTKQIRSNNSSLPLRLKIAFGYILLMVQLGIVVFVLSGKNGFYFGIMDGQLYVAAVDWCAIK